MDAAPCEATNSRKLVAATEEEAPLSGWSAQRLITAKRKTGADGRGGTMTGVSKNRTWSAVYTTEPTGPPSAVKAQESSATACTRSSPSLTSDTNDQNRPVVTRGGLDHRRLRARAGFGELDGMNNSMSSSELPLLESISAPPPNWAEPPISTPPM